MATLTTIWWRDIPAQVTARDGRKSSKIVLHPRFQVAIDKAASRAGKRAYNDYIEEWHKTQRPCSDDLDHDVAAEVDRLETEYDKHRLAQLITSGGVEGGPAFPPAHDETPGKAARESSGGAAETSGEAQNKAQPS
jgi:hypothetical protein